MKKLLLSIIGICILGVTTFVGEEVVTISNGISDLLQKAVSKQLKNNELLYRYIYEEQEIIDELTDLGEVRSSKSETYTWIHTKLQSFTKLIAVNGAQYDDSYLKKQDKQIIQSIADVDLMSLQKQKKMFLETQRERKGGVLPTLFNNFLMAFVFSRQGEQEINGIKTLVVDFRPLGNFKVPSQKSLFLARMKGRLWVTKKTHQVIRFTAILDDDIHYLAGILGSIKKGATITFEQAKIGNGLWFPTFRTLTYREDVFFKNAHLRRTNLYRNYRLNSLFKKQSLVQVERLH